MQLQKANDKLTGLSDTGQSIHDFANANNKRRLNSPDSLVLQASNQTDADSLSDTLFRICEN
jgi:hypothetical protein